MAQESHPRTLEVTGFSHQTVVQRKEQPAQTLKQEQTQQPLKGASGSIHLMPTSKSGCSPNAPRSRMHLQGVGDASVPGGWVLGLF
jgi:hypothetical protein